MVFDAALKLQLHPAHEDKNCGDTPNPQEDGAIEVWADAVSATVTNEDAARSSQLPELLRENETESGG